MLLVLDEIERLGRSLLERENPLELKFGNRTHYDLVQVADQSGKVCEARTSSKLAQKLTARDGGGDPLPPR